MNDDVTKPFSGGMPTEMGLKIEEWAILELSD